jgi:cation transport ATPase
MRFKSPRLYKNRELCKTVQIYIENLEGIMSVEANDTIGTLLILFDENKVTGEHLIHSIEAAFIYAAEDKGRSLAVYEDYCNTVEERARVKRKIFLYSALFLLLRLKTLAFGKFSLRRNMYLIYLVSALALIRGYPLLKRLNKLVQCFYGDAEALLEFTALILTLVRESERGVLVLLFKNINDYIMLSADCNCRRTLLKYKDRSENKSGIAVTGSQNPLLPEEEAVQGQEVYNLKTLPVISASSFNNSVLYHRVSGYQHRMGPIALAAGALNLLLTGSPLRAISTLLVLSPAASELALTAGIKNYTALLAKRGIYLRNPYAIERLADNNALGSATISPVDLRAMGISFLSSGCERDIMNSDCIIGDNNVEKLKELTVLSTKAYGKIQRDITTAQAYNWFFGALSFFMNLDLFTAEGINTVNSLLMLMLSERIRWTRPSEDFKAIG